MEPRCSDYTKEMGKKIKAYLGDTDRERKLNFLVFGLFMLFLVGQIFISHSTYSYCDTAGCNNCVTHAAMNIFYFHCSMSFQAPNSVNTMQ